MLLLSGAVWLSAAQGKWSAAPRKPKTTWGWKWANFVLLVVGVGLPGIGQDFLPPLFKHAYRRKFRKESPTPSAHQARDAEKRAADVDARTAELWEPRSRSSKPRREAESRSRKAPVFARKPPRQIARARSSRRRQEIETVRERSRSRAVERLTRRSCRSISPSSGYLRAPERGRRKRGFGRRICN